MNIILKSFKINLGMSKNFFILSFNIFYEELTYLISTHKKLILFKKENEKFIDLYYRELNKYLNLF
jgi:hypothetical protein